MRNMILLLNISTKHMIKKKGKEVRIESSMKKTIVIDLLIQSSY